MHSCAAVTYNISLLHWRVYDLLQCAWNSTLQFNGKLAPLKAISPHSAATAILHSLLRQYCHYYTHQGH